MSLSPRSIPLVALLLECTLLSGCVQPADIAAAGPNTPGWTGRTIVIGSHSTILGDAEATYNQQKWPFDERH